MPDRIYAAIDLKSFYASCECVRRGLDPLNTNLVVADISRTEKTICLAVSPSLKSFGVSSRPRLFEVNQFVKKLNDKRKKENKNKEFLNGSYYLDKLNSNKDLKIQFLIARPRMAEYMKMSNKIYSIYLKYFSKDDIHVYSIDEVFIDLTSYLKLYQLTPLELISKVIKEVFSITKITATAGIGTNLFLAKVAMDILAKKAKPNIDGVRIAYLDEKIFKEKLWEHTPLTDFWRIGPGISKRLIANGMNNLGDVCLVALKNQDLLFKLFGINAELLIDHAFGKEPCTIKEIKEYKPLLRSNSIGQVMSRGYSYIESELIIKEMADELALSLNEKKLVTSQIVISLCYDSDFDIENYKGELCYDLYGKICPYPAHGTININHFTNSYSTILKACIELFNRIIDPNLKVRRFNISCNIKNLENRQNEKFTQLDVFNEQDELDKLIVQENNENLLNNAIISIKNKYGKNAILKGNSLLDSSTQKKRNSEVGGHKA